MFQSQSVQIAFTSKTLKLITLFLCLWQWGHASSTARERNPDKDKKRLFHTWYLDGDKATWILSLRADRTYDLIGPNGKRSTGNYNPSSKALAFKSKTIGFLRHFSYSFSKDTLRLSPTKKDAPQKGSLLGELPPVTKGQKSRFISLELWKRQGKTTAVIGKSNASAKTDDPTIIKTIPIAKKPSTVTGHFTFEDLENGAYQLHLKKDGTFELGASDKKKVRGTYLYFNGELSLSSLTHRRNLNVRTDPDGMLFSRRTADVLKLDNSLGEMPPQSRLPLLWKRVTAKGDLVATKDPLPKVDPRGPMKPITPIDTPKATPTKKDPEPEPRQTTTTTTTPEQSPPEKIEPVAPPIKQPTRPIPDKQATKVQPILKKDPPKKDNPPASRLSLARIEGTYVYSPNPLTKETLQIKKDGTFTYANNGGNVKGKIRVKGNEIHLEAGTVTRHLMVKLVSGKDLEISRTKADSPKIANDLATMSPSILKSALYKKQ